ncbi:MAG: transposase [Chloroflexales bacterium]|nr:transposase [Chloroflexales bacterium]
MRNLPGAIIHVLRAFELLFSEPVWEWARILLIGAILAPGKRTVTAVLRVMGLSDAAPFQHYHRVRNRAVWSPRAVRRVLLRLRLAACVPPAAPVILGRDAQLERRRGANIKAKGLDRDPVRASKSFFVKSRGLRWLCLLRLTPIPWAQRVWALPCLTVLAPAERSHQERGPQHKTRTDWARQLIIQVRTWLPERLLVVVADSTDAASALRAACPGLPQPVTRVSRLRRAAALDAPAPARRPGQRGRPAKQGKRQPSLLARVRDPQTTGPDHTAPWYGRTTRPVQLASGTAVWDHSGVPPVAIRWVLVRDPAGTCATQALLRTNLAVTPTQMVAWFVMRWPVEVTVEEARAHLGSETQRQWSDRAVLRTTPVLLGLFALVTRCAHHLLQGGAMPLRQAAWDTKAVPTFSDTFAFVRQQLWPVTIAWMSPDEADTVKIPVSLRNRLPDARAYAA